MSCTAGSALRSLLAAFAEQHGTPVPVYRPDVLAADLAHLTAAATGFGHGLGIVVGLTADDIPPALDDLRCAGVGVDVATAERYDVALAARFCAEQIVVNPCCASDGLLSRAVSDGAFVTLASPLEVDAAERCCAGRDAVLPVGLRLVDQPGSAGAREMVRRLLASSVLELRGLHCDLAPEVLGTQSSLDMLIPVLHLAATLRGRAPLDRIIVRVRHEPARDLAPWFRELGREWGDRCLRDVTLVLEPGAGITSRCVQILASVTAVDLGGAAPLVVLDAGVGRLSVPTPGQPLLIEFLGRTPARDGEAAAVAVTPAVVVGPLRNESDVLRYGCPVPADLAPGDLVIIHDPGGHDRAPVVLRAPLSDAASR